MLKHLLLLIGLTTYFSSYSQKIDRQAVLLRNNPHITAVDTLGSLTVGNGHFATTVDITGLQSFPEKYENGIPLCAMSDWGWHSFPNDKNLKSEESWDTLNLNHGHKEIYATEFKKPEHRKKATEYFRVNPHRLNLGNIGFKFTNKGKKLQLNEITSIDQTLNLYDGNIRSFYTVKNTPVEVTTTTHPHLSALFFSAKSKLFRKGEASIQLRLPYPTGKHADAASDWISLKKHKSKIISLGTNFVTIEHSIDTTTYYITLSWQGKAKFNTEKGKHSFTLQPMCDSINVLIEYTQRNPNRHTFTAFDFKSSLDIPQTSIDFWHHWWQEGAFVDFSLCTDPRARELERRVILSQYLTYVNCAGNTPPQETGLTYNSWYGRPHLEMTWWHLVDFSLWNHPDVLQHSVNWYTDVAYPYAKEIAKRQSFKGVRWMKMTDPWAGEAPSNIGSFLTWQQPHYIYLAEELYRRNPSKEILSRYAKCIEETAKFLYDFAKSCGQQNGCIRLYGHTAMQESMNKDIAYCQPFEQAYFVYGLNVAQKWRERLGLPRNPEWDMIIRHMAPLPGTWESGNIIQDSLYCSSLPINKIWDESFLEKSHSDHPAILGACGLLPDYGLYNKDIMQRTMNWIFNNWNWDTTWGWDYGMTAMCAARLGDGEAAIKALLIDKDKNTYLVNGHNFQEPKRLRLYLPGNGALLDAVAMMCAGWDGCPEINNPGFPQNGKWNVRWEGLHKMQ